MSKSSIPAVGKKAPAFHLDTDSGTKIRLSELAGSPVVLYFYPKDNTPGCTTEAQDFRDAQADFEKLGVRILGVSPDSVKSHEKFCTKQELNFTLLSDPHHKTIDKYGLWVEKKLYGRVYWGVERATLLIDAEGMVSQVWPKVKVPGHAADVLEAARKLVKG
jgi:thioredoxin-dependent peroxiredoxin